MAKGKKKDKTESRLDSSSNVSPSNSEFKTSTPAGEDSSSTTESSEKDEAVPGLSQMGQRSASPVQRRQSSRRPNSGTLLEGKNFNIADAFDDGEPHENKDHQRDRADDSDDSQPSGRVVKHKRPQKILKKTSGSIRSRRDSHKKLPSTESNEGYNFIGGLLLSAGIFLLAVSINVFSGGCAPGTTSKDFDHFQVTFKNEVINLKREFPAQTERTWRIVQSSVKSVLRSNPVQPSVLLFVAEDENGKGVSQCLARKLSRMASNLFVNDTKVTEEALKGDSIKSKMDLQNALKFSLSSRHSALLFDLEQLEGGFAMALHAFTDNNNAPVKDAVIILTINIEKGDISDNLERAVEKILTRKWSDKLDEDRISPLLSRIAVSVALIKEEPQRNNHDC